MRQVAADSLVPEDVLLRRPADDLATAGDRRGVLAGEAFSPRRLVLERPQERPPGGLQAERELVDGVSPDRREPAS